MVRYRRNYVAGGTYAFTATRKDRRSDLLLRRVDALRAAIRDTAIVHPFATHAMLVMPDHLHAIWQLPERDADYSLRWRLIKTHFNRRVGRNGNPWQPRFWEHTIRDESDLENHVAYIHFNPVKHGHVAVPSHWRCSTIHRWIRDGRLAPDWGADASPADLAFGERR